MSKGKPREVLKRALYETDVDIFSREPGESAKTVCILGRSFSGKTHFLVQQLNKLAGRKRGGQCENKGKKRCKCGDKDRPMYDMILLFSESLSAEPLKGLDPRVNLKLVEGYVPKVVQLLKQINDASENAFRFLVILDDVVSGIRSGTFVKQVLTMRNAQISTVILTQYAKLLSPAARNSFHHFYITGLKPEEWEYMNKSFLSANVKELIGDMRSAPQLATEFKKWVGDDIVHYDQRKDELSFIHRDLKFR